MIYVKKQILKGYLVILYNDKMEQLLALSATEKMVKKINGMKKRI